MREIALSCGRFAGVEACWSRSAGRRAHRHTAADARCRPGRRPSMPAVTRTSRSHLRRPSPRRASCSRTRSARGCHLVRRTSTAVRSACASAAELLPALGTISHIESYFSFRRCDGRRTDGRPLRADLQLLDILPHPVYLLLAMLERAGSGSDRSRCDTRWGRRDHPCAAPARMRRQECSRSRSKGRPVESYLRVVGQQRVDLRGFRARHCAATHRARNLRNRQGCSRRTRWRGSSAPAPRPRSDAASLEATAILPGTRPSCSPRFTTLRAGRQPANVRGERRAVRSCMGASRGGSCQSRCSRTRRPAIDGQANRQSS